MQFDEILQKFDANYGNTLPEITTLLPSFMASFMNNELMTDCGSIKLDDDSQSFDKTQTLRVYVRQADEYCISSVSFNPCYRFLL